MASPASSSAWAPSPRKRALALGGCPGRRENESTRFPARTSSSSTPRVGGSTPRSEGRSRRRPRSDSFYLACGLDALIADLAALTAPGRLRLAGIEVFDFFPFTDHVETLVWLDRNGRQSGGRSS